MKQNLMFREDSVSRLVGMAWEDRTPFEAIAGQFGLSPSQVIKIMRQELKPSSFRLWRKRTSGRRTKHQKVFQAHRSRAAVVTFLAM